MSLICKRTFPRFYYPKGIAGFWSSHVNGPLCKFSTTFKDGVSVCDYKELLDLEKFDRDVNDMSDLFTCTKEQLYEWANDIIYSEITEVDMHDHYLNKYGGFPEEKDEEDIKYDMDIAFSTDEIKFWSTVGMKDSIEHMEFIRNVASAIANTNITIWLSILQKDKTYQKEVIRFIIDVTGQYDVYWLTELSESIEKLCDKSFDNLI